MKMWIQFNVMPRTVYLCIGIIDIITSCEWPPSLIDDIDKHRFPVSIRVAEIYVMSYLLPVNGRHL